MALTKVGLASSIVAIALVALAVPGGAGATTINIDNGSFVTGDELEPSEEAGPAPSPDPYDSPDFAEWQLAFGELTLRLQEEFPDAYANRVINPDRLSGTVQFANEVPVDAQRLIDGVPGVTAQRGAGYTASQRKGVEESAYAAVAHALPNDVGYLMSLDHASNTLWIQMGGSDRAANAAAQGLETAVQAAARGVGVSKVVIQVLDQAPVDLQLTAGGRIYKDGAFQCSSAFPVKRVSGPEIGLFTAGHCPGQGVAYNGPISPAYFTVLGGSQITDYGSQGGDFRWLWSNTMFDGYTYVGTGNRIFASTGFAQGGDFLCKYGTVSGYGCAYITGNNYITNVQLPPESGGTWRQVGPLACVIGSVSSGQHMQPGDSGGSWFLNGTAYGIHNAGNGTTPRVSRRSATPSRDSVSTCGPDSGAPAHCGAESHRRGPCVVGVRDWSES